MSRSFIIIIVDSLIFNTTHTHTHVEYCALSPIISHKLKRNERKSQNQHMNTMQNAKHKTSDKMACERQVKLPCSNTTEYEFITRLNSDGMSFYRSEQRFLSVVKSIQYSR